MSTTFPTPAALTSFRPLHAAPVAVYAAIIEWPDDFMRSPTLILSRSAASRDMQVFQAVEEMAHALTDPEWSLIMAGAPETEYPEASTWKEWIEFHFEDADQAPGIIYREMVV